MAENWTNTRRVTQPVVETIEVLPALTKAQAKTVTTKGAILTSIYKVFEKIPGVASATKALSKVLRLLSI